MGARGGGGGRRGGHHGHRKNRRAEAAAEVERLKAWLKAAAPPRGSLGLGTGEAEKKQPPGLVIGADGTGVGSGKGKEGPRETFPSFSGVKRFTDLPISQATVQGLKAAKFTVMTAIQRAALPHALCGRDVLGAAKTGSGKTLAFCIPLLEALFREQWSTMDGLGALVMTPTRELALQIFDELRKVGKAHGYSAGLLIGGKSVKEEKRFVNGMTILVATPGRLLQHMDETPGFDCSNLQVLILDEADRILDMGFSQTLNAILENLPRTRQTMLFSATQTRSVKDLARLSLRDPEYVAVHAEATSATPLKLRQGYTVCEAHEKLDMLWSFLRSHLLNKTICFLSTCKQVRFVFETFKRLRPGVPLRMLHGKMKQMKRMAVFYEFCEAKEMVLFATDIASRGLDFPSVDWVLQMDCPEDVAQYIHRVGRTARFTAAGHALLYLAPSEQAMAQQLKEANIAVTPIKVNPSKLQTVTPAMQALVSKSTELKELAQRALVSYLRSVFLAPNKPVYDVTALNVEELSASFGLMAAPKLRFLKKVSGRRGEGDGEGGEAGEECGTIGSWALTASNEAANRMVIEPSVKAAGEGRKASDAGPQRIRLWEGEEEEGEGFMRIKRRIGDESGAEEAAAAAAGEELAEEEELVARPTKLPKRMKIKVGAANPHAKRVVFDDDGNERNPLELLGRGSDDDVEEEDHAGARRKGGQGLDVGVHKSSGERMREVARLMKQRDAEDRKQEKLKRKEKKIAAKTRAREEGGAEEDGARAVLDGSARDGSDSDDEDGEEAPSLVAMGDDGGASSSGDDSSDDDEEEVPAWYKKKGAAKKKVKAEGAHVKNPEDLDVMSMSDKQALALQLLQKGGRR